KGKGAEALQSRQERIRSGARSGGQYAGEGNERDLVPLKPVDGGGSRGDSITIDGKDFLVPGAVDERRELPAKRVHVWVQHSLGQSRSHRRVKCVATGVQDTHPGLGREGAYGSDHSRG